MQIKIKHNKSRLNGILLGKKCCKIRQEIFAT
jgi:hypothetical protein